MKPLELLLKSPLQNLLLKKLLLKPLDSPLRRPLEKRKN
jgi:hypothetical protein